MLSAIRTTVCYEGLSSLDLPSLLGCTNHRVCSCFSWKAPVFYGRTFFACRMCLFLCVYVFRCDRCLRVGPLKSRTGLYFHFFPLSEPKNSFLKSLSPICIHDRVRLATFYLYLNDVEEGVCDAIKQFLMVPKDRLHIPSTPNSFKWYAFTPPSLYQK